MANYDIPKYPIKRLRYFNNQFLKDQDFVDDSASSLAREQAFLRSLCAPGVCEGLAVLWPATNKPPTITPGLAVDPKGRLIVLDQNTDAPVSPAALADGDYVVHISFSETEDARATGQGASDYTRWKQIPAIGLTATNAGLSVDAVVLGSCTVQGGQFTGPGTTARRQYGGLRLPGDVQFAGPTLRGTGAAVDLAVLAGSLTIRRDLPAPVGQQTGQLGPKLTLQNSSGGAGAGGAIDFNGYDPGSNDPSLRIQSLNDGSASSHLTFATKQSGAATNNLVERLRLTSDGLLQFPTDAKDKIVLSDNGTDRYGIGLNSSNISLFCPTSASFSLRQNSSSGAEVFSVSGSGTAKIRRDVAGQIGPTLTLLNGAGGNGASSAIDFNSYDPGTNDPVLRIQSLDAGGYTSHLTFSTKRSGDPANPLVERLRLTSDGLLKFPNEAPKDKIVLWDSGVSDRYGIGMNASNINLFYPSTASFSLRQNSSTGTEVLSVSSSGTITVKGSANQQAYFGLDSNGLLIGSIKSGTNRVSLYNTATTGWIDLICGTVNQASDERLKDHIESIPGALDKIVRLRGVSFDWKVDPRPEGSPKHLGLVAQQVREVVPEAVMDANDGLLSIAYNAITALLIEAVKEQQKHIDELRAALTPAAAC
jgi:hypothetical protein